jgi:hypothetical protein
MSTPPTAVMPHADTSAPTDATAPIGPGRPGRVTLAAVLMTLLAVLVGIAGCLLLVGLAFGTFVYMAMGGQAPSSLLVIGAVGVVACALGIVELRVAMLVYRGDRWGRRLAVALALAGTVYGLVTVATWSGVIDGLAANLGFVALNVVVIVALLTANHWFDAVEAALPSGTHRSPVSRVVPWLAALGVLVALVALTASTAKVFGDDRPTAYLASLPETRLAYPGATLLGSSSTPADAWFGTTRSATVTSRYEARATAEEVTDWYARELAARDWLRRDINLSSSGQIPVWHKDYAEIQLGHVRQDSPGVTRFSITAYARHGREDPAPLRRVQAMPELELVYPGSDQQETGEGLGRRTSDHNVQPAYVVRRYDTEATPADVLAFFDRELTARGWTAQGPVSKRGERTWVRDDAEFSLHAYDPEGRTVNAYSFEIREVPGPEATPFDPWP